MGGIDAEATASLANRSECNSLCQFPRRRLIFKCRGHLQTNYSGVHNAEPMSTTEIEIHDKNLFELLNKVDSTLEAIQGAPRTKRKDMVRLFFTTPLSRFPGCSALGPRHSLLRRLRHSCDLISPRMGFFFSSFFPPLCHFISDVCSPRLTMSTQT